MSDEMKRLALRALEETAAMAMYRPGERSHSVRFAMAYLWSLKPDDRQVFDELWRALADVHAGSGGRVNWAVAAVFRYMEVERDEKAQSAMQTEVQARHERAKLLALRG